jgi:uncharacterized protein YdiU (UPF0061 family)
MKSDIKKEKLFQDSNFIDWHKRWSIRLNKNKKPKELSLNLMSTNNPLVIPRNHKVVKSLDAASNEGNLKPLHNLLSYLKKPYEKQAGISDFQVVPKLSRKKYKTFCGT